MIYYVKPLHLQKAYERFPRTPGGLPVSEALPRQILCLPMHPYRSIADQDRVIKAIRTFLEGQAGATAAAPTARASFTSGGSSSCAAEWRRWIGNLRACERSVKREALKR